MLGYAHPAGFRNGPREDACVIARYFSASEEKVRRALAMIETAARPEILLLQNPAPNAKVGAVVLFSSVWSTAYVRFGTPFGRVHRDFHYQTMFAALAALVEAGCERMRIDNPLSGRLWRRDAYICLQDATQNLRTLRVPRLTVSLREDDFAPAMQMKVDAGIATFDLQNHRPVGISPHVFEGMNMRTVFVEKAGDAVWNDTGLAPS
jgi:hypothetical protein